MRSFTRDRAATSARILRGKYSLLLVLSAIVTLGSNTGFAQDATSKSLPQQSDAEVTRQRRLPEAVVSIGFDREPSRGPRRVFVLSTSLLVRGAVVEDKLLKRPEFNQLGFVITREKSEADLILELRHDLFTKYVFTVVDARTQTVLAGGKLSSLGGTVAGKVAKRFVGEMMRLQGP